MRTRSLAAAVAALVALLALPACKSTQPEQTAKQVALVSFSATALNSVYDCWDVATSVNPTGLWCEQEFDPRSNLPVLRSSIPLAFRYSVEISVIPEGQTAETVVASSAPPTGDVPQDFPTFGSVTDFDPRVDPGPATPQNPPDPTAVYSNPRTVSKGSQLYAKFASLRFPAPNVLFKSGGFPVELHKGDTIIVRARKIELDQAEENFQTDQDAELKLVGNLSVGGIPSNALGITTSPTIDGGGVTFSLTVR